MYNESKVLCVLWLWHPRTQARHARRKAAAALPRSALEPAGPSLTLWRLLIRFSLNPPATRAPCRALCFAR